MTVFPFDTQDFKYYLLPGRPHPGFPATETYNKVYLFWREVWAQVFKEHGKPEALSPDDFARQDLVQAILYRGRVVSLGLNSFFDLDQAPTAELKYFGSFNRDDINFLRSKKGRSLLSMEFLTVCPEFRKVSTGFSLAHIIAELGFKLLLHLDLDVAVATVRKEKHAMVNELAARLGGKVLQRDVLRGNILCDLMCVFQEDYSSLKDLRVKSLVTQLWETRLDLTGKTLSNLTKDKKVA